MNVEAEILKLYEERRLDFVRIASRLISQGSYNPERLAQWGPEDVVQEAFTRALYYKDSFDHKLGSLTKWFNRILHGCAIDFRKDERLGGLADEIKDSDYIVESCFGTDNKLIEEVKRDVAKLDGDVKQICQLYFINQYKPREIVQITGHNSTYVRTTVKNFLAKLREKYE